VLLILLFIPKASATCALRFAGIEAMFECASQQCMPAMTRLNEPDKTALSLAFRPPASRLTKIAGALFKSYLRAKGFAQRPAQDVPDADCF
jgi:hypothetical protein